MNKNSFSYEGCLECAHFHRPDCKGMCVYISKPEVTQIINILGHYLVWNKLTNEQRESVEKAAKELNKFKESLK